eukprot:353858-Chlamydomonas_euryale.AAC.6
MQVRTIDTMITGKAAAFGAPALLLGTPLQRRRQQQLRRSCGAWQRGGFATSASAGRGSGVGSPRPLLRGVAAGWVRHVRVLPHTPAQRPASMLLLLTSGRASAAIADTPGAEARPRHRHMAGRDLAIAGRGLAIAGRGLAIAT